MRKVLPLLTILALLGFGQVALAESKDYVGPFGVAGGCGGQIETVNWPAFGVGMQCFEIPAGINSATIEVVDSQGNSVPFDYEYRPRGWGCAGDCWRPGPCSGSVTRSDFQGWDDGGYVFVAASGPEATYFRCGILPTSVSGTITVTYN